MTVPTTAAIPLRLKEKPRDLTSSLPTQASPKSLRPTKGDDPALWFDTLGFAKLTGQDRSALLARVTQGRFNGVLVHADELATLAPHLQALPGRFTLVVVAESPAAWASVNGFLGAPTQHVGERKCTWTVASHDVAILDDAESKGFASALRMRVDDAESLHRAIALGKQRDVLMIAFKDSTNIPLELVIAELHKTQTLLLKETASSIDDAVIALGVLELGSDGVVVAFRNFPDFDYFAARLEEARNRSLEIDEAVIVQTRHLGLGYRACIDTTHLFQQDEGLLVGSTSGGAILCCPEVFHLPYMELRPFRINAASIHSYIFMGNGRTAYISELRAGASLTAVHRSGRTREIFVGRSKIEIRPLILIEAEGSNNRRLNIIMQDDWHVRVFSHECKPLNVTELKRGDRVLAHFAQPGRHVGIAVNEHIIEC